MCLFLEFHTSARYCPKFFLYLMHWNIRRDQPVVCHEFLHFQVSKLRLCRRCPVTEDLTSAFALVDCLSWSAFVVETGRNVLHFHGWSPSRICILRTGTLSPKSDPHISKPGPWLGRALSTWVWIEHRRKLSYEKKSLRTHQHDRLTGQGSGGKCRSGCIYHAIDPK